MRKIGWQLQMKNKYYHLLALLISFFFIAPFISGQVVHFPIFSLVFLLGIMFTLRALEVKRSIFLFIVLIGVLGLISDLFFNYFSPMYFKQNYQWGSILIYANFLLVSIVLLISKMFSVSKVTSDTIAGGISVYLLFGFLWTAFYYAIYIFDRRAFNFSSQFSEYSLFYFSFSTITTLGYGDIYPVNKLAMSISNLEVITGQMYVAIFISRLVGLHTGNFKK
ncbi:MAG: ion channel [Candidatus Omnitrophica bacterium]|nr:ion channel [Candidatus Omnitrophota bacterium]